MPTYSYNRVSQRMMVADNTGSVFREMNDREMEILAAQLTLLPVSLPAIEGIAAPEKPLHSPVTQEQFQSALKEIRDKFALKSDVVNALKAAEELIYELPDRFLDLCVALACLGLFAAVVLAVAAGDWITRKAMQ